MYEKLLSFEAFKTFKHWNLIAIVKVDHDYFHDLLIYRKYKQNCSSDATKHSVVMQYLYNWMGYECEDFDSFLTNS